MKYLDEIKDIVNTYRQLSFRANEIQIETNKLLERKQSLDAEYAKNKELEEALIDKIIKETGKKPNYFEIFQKL